MIDIDWSKAPEWAEAHALYAFGGEIYEAWIGVEQYQRLDHPKPFPYGDSGVFAAQHNPRRSWFKYVTPRPAPWDGEGLPPVGTVCEYQTWVNREWKQTKVLAHHLGFAVHSWSVDGNDMEVDSAPPQDFRPIRTPEQIAAEDRVRAAQKWLQDIEERYGQEVAGKCEDILMQAESSMQVKP